MRKQIILLDRCSKVKFMFSAGWGMPSNGTFLIEEPGQYHSCCRGEIWLQNIMRTGLVCSWCPVSSGHKSYTNVMVCFWKENVPSSTGKSHWTQSDKQGRLEHQPIRSTDRILKQITAHHFASWNTVNVAPQDKLRTKAQFKFWKDIPMVPKWEGACFPVLSAGRSQQHTGGGRRQQNQ